MEGIVLGRIGHYFDAGNGSCSTALVVHVDDSGTDDEPDLVAVQAWHHGGEPFSRTSVPVAQVVAGEDYHSNSFHLNRDCPWAR